MSRQKDKILKRIVVTSSNTGSKISKGCALNPVNSNKDRKKCRRISQVAGCNEKCVKVLYC